MSLEQWRKKNILTPGLQKKIYNGLRNLNLIANFRRNEAFAFCNTFIHRIKDQIANQKYIKITK